MNLRRTHAFTLAVALAATSATSAFADDLFVISGTSNGTNFAPVGANNLIDLVSDAVNNEGQFTALANTTAVLNLNYGGVADAISIEKNAANNFATLSFVNADGTRTTRTFDAVASGQSLEDLIRDYLQGDGADDLATFFEAMNAQSLIAVSDGNPNATTARMANSIFNRFGRYNRQTSMWTVTNDTNERTGVGMQARFNLSGARFEADDFEGTTADAQASFDWNFSPYVGTSLGVFAGYTGIEGANVYHGGVDFGVPIRPLLAREGLPLTLQITPSVSIGGSGSEEIGAGGLIYSGAITGLLRWDITKRLGIDFSAQYGFYEGETLSFDEYEIDPGVSQQILKHGASVDWAIGEQGWYLFGGASFTEFMQDAALESYISPDFGIGWRRANKPGTNFEVGFTGDYGEDYSATGVRLGINLQF